MQFKQVHFINIEEYFDSTDEDSARAEAKKNIQQGLQGYSNAEVVVKLGGWDASYSKAVAQASLSALRRLILSDKKLPGFPFYSLYRMLLFFYL